MRRQQHRLEAWPRVLGRQPAGTAASRSPTRVGHSVGTAAVGSSSTTPRRDPPPRRGPGPSAQAAERAGLVGRRGRAS